MEKKETIICIVVGFLGLFSASSGFAAEGTKNKASEVSIIGSTCVYPSSPASGLGFTGSAILLVAQVIVSFTKCCACCKRGDPDNSSTAICISQGICLSISWVTTGVAMFMFVGGALLNKRKTEVRVRHYEYYCDVVRSGIFIAAGVLTLASVFFGIAYIKLASRSKHNSNRDAEQPGAELGFENY